MSAPQITTNTFSGGMNQDSAWDFFKPNEYREAVNFRPTADDEGDSTGSLSLIKGNESNFPFPSVYNVITLEPTATFVNDLLDANEQTITADIDSSSINYTFRELELDNFYSNFVTFLRSNFPDLIIQTNGSKILFYNPAGNSTISITEHTSTISTSAVSDKLVVLGYTRLREETIIFTCPIVSDGSGQIWRVSWDANNKATVTLVRHASDVFSPEYEIEAKSRYENIKIKRAYWTDNSNPLRGINIESDSTFLDLVNLVPAINFDVPKLTELKQTGGELPSGWYAYAYRLKNLQGNETTISRFSPNIHITDENELTDDHWEIHDREIGAPTKKSLLGTIENLDISYQYLDVIVAYTAKEGAIPFYYVIEQDVTIDGNPVYNFEHGAIDGLNPLTEAELISPTAFSTCKSIEILNNRLYAANLKSDSTILNDFDFTSIRTKQNGFTEEGYELTDDKINPYNRDSTAADGNSNQHKYKGNSWTLGGIGDLIDFEFITQDFILDGDDEMPTGRKALWKLTDSNKVSNLILNGIDYSMGNLWKSYKNPFFASLFKGYMRSEVYRFGIEFFDNRGNTLGVKWIADIRMPEQADFPAFQQIISGTQANPTSYLQGNALGVKFDVRVPAELQSKCSGFRIVRAERTSSDETIRAQGMIEDVATVKLSNTPSGKELYTYKFSRNVDSFGVLGPVLQSFDGVDTALEHRLKLCNFPQLAFEENKSEELDAFSLRPVCKIWPVDTLSLNQDFTAATTSQDRIKINKYWLKDFPNYQSSLNIFKEYSVKIEDSTYVLPVDTINGRQDRGDDIFTIDLTSSHGGYLNYADALNGQYGQAGVGAYAAQWMGGRGQQTYAMRMTDGNAVSRSMSYLGIETDPTNSLTQLNYTHKPIYNLYRELTNQYGGDKLSDIERTKYIPVGHYQAITPGVASYECEVFGGDTFINMYDEVGAFPSSNAGAFSPALDDFARDISVNGDAQGYGLIYPVESRVNIDLRSNVHLANFGVLGTAQDNLVSSDAIIDRWGYESWLSDYQRSDFGVSLSSFATFADEFDNRIIVSGAKTNGESIDSWSVFRALDRLEVEGNYGPINKIGVLNDKLLFWQDRAFGYILSNPRIQTQGTDDISIQLGVSQEALYDHDYLSRKIGSYHQKSIFQSPTGWYWFDINNKRPYKYGGQKGIEEYAEMKGMHSFFSREVDNNLLGVERNPFGQGIHGTYDYVNNEALFTFNSPKVLIEQGQESYDANIERFPSLYIPIGTGVVVDDQEYVVIKGYYGLIGNLVPINIITSEYLLAKDEHLSKGFTIAMNHLTQKWSAFYGFKPNIYINTEDKILTPNPNNQDEVFLHNVGDYSTFYGETKDANLKLIVNKEPLQTKVWDNISWHNKTRDVSGTRGRALDTSTFSEFNCHTDYQHSGNITLEQSGLNRNLTKVEGEWRMAVPANVVTETGSDIDILDPNNWDTTRVFKDRMRDKYIYQSFTYKPENAQFILDYINNYFRVSHR